MQLAELANPSNSGTNADSDEWSSRVMKRVSKSSNRADRDFPSNAGDTVDYMHPVPALVPSLRPAMMQIVGYEDLSGNVVNFPNPDLVGSDDAIIPVSSHQSQALSLFSAPSSYSTPLDQVRFSAPRLPSSPRSIGETLGAGASGVWAGGRVGQVRDAAAGKIEQGSNLKNQTILREHVKLQRPGGTLDVSWLFFFSPFFFIVVEMLYLVVPCIICRQELLELMVG